MVSNGDDDDGDDEVGGVDGDGYDDDNLGDVAEDVAEDAAGDDTGEMCGLASLRSILEIFLVHNCWRYQILQPRLP